MVIVNVWDCVIWYEEEFYKGDNVGLWFILSSYVILGNYCV